MDRSKPWWNCRSAIGGQDEAVQAIRDAIELPSSTENSVVELKRWDNGNLQS